MLFVWFLVGQYHFHNTASNKFILFQVHALDNVATVIENATNIFRVDGAREMRVTVDRVWKSGQNWQKNIKKIDLFGTKAKSHFFKL